MTTIALRNETVRLFRSRYTFIVLQALDLATTLVAFRMGGFEMNPLVARLAVFLGPIGGILCSKAITCLIVLRVRRLVWVLTGCRYLARVDELLTVGKTQAQKP